METELNSSPEEGKKIRLRRLNLNRNDAPISLPTAPLDQKIQKNLEPLKQNVQKKMIAQQFFYERNPQGTSPMVRNSKPPVRQRLGKRIQLRRLAFTGTSTSSVPPKMRRQTLQNRMYSAQLRINRIRQAQQNGNNFSLMSPFPMRKSIRLRRTLPNNLFSSQPANFTVQVRNNNFQATHQRPKKFKMCLDPRIQAEIRELQIRHVSHPLCLDSLAVPVKSTDQSLHLRFASY